MMESNVDIRDIKKKPQPIKLEPSEIAPELESNQYASDDGERAEIPILVDENQLVDIAELSQNLETYKRQNLELPNIRFLNPGTVDDKKECNKFRFSKFIAGMEQEKQQSKKLILAKFYQLGGCQHGEECIYKHSKGANPKHKGQRGRYAQQKRKFIEYKDEYIEQGHKKYVELIDGIYDLFHTLSGNLKEAILPVLKSPYSPLIACLDNLLKAGIETQSLRPDVERMKGTKKNAIQSHSGKSVDLSDIDGRCKWLIGATHLMIDKQYWGIIENFKKMLLMQDMVLQVNYYQKKIAPEIRLISKSVLDIHSILKSEDVIALVKNLILEMLKSGIKLIYDRLNEQCSTAIGSAKKLDREMAELKNSYENIREALFARNLKIFDESESAEEANKDDSSAIKPLLGPNIEETLSSPRSKDIRMAYKFQ